MTSTRQRPRRRQLITLVTTLALAALTGAAAVAFGTGTANAAAAPDLTIAQHVSGSSTSGHTFVTFVIANTGSASASHVNLEIFTTTAGAFSDVFLNGPVVCDVMPAPTPYNYGTACQVSGTLDPGTSVSTKADFGGSAGRKFTNYAGVGEFQGDANVANNHSTITSWFGPRADLAVSGTATTGTKAGHATTITTVLNHGPNTANSLQETIEVKNVSGAKATASTGGTTSCQTIPAASGYDFAASCVVSSVGTGKKWSVTLDYHGTSGQTMTALTKISSLTIDPATANNSMTRKAKLK